MNEKVIFECIVGSHAYGTNIETSDIDIKGVYQQANTDILGFNYKEQVNVDKDTTYYEIRRFIELLAQANPTVLEMLFVADRFIKINTPQFQILRDNRQLFLTKQCANSFGGYALAQIKKAKGLNKKMNWEKDKTIRKTPAEFCYIQNRQRAVQLDEFLSNNDLQSKYCGLSAINHMPNCYLLYYDYPAEHADDIKDYKGFGYNGICFENSNDIKLSSIPKEQIGEHLGIVYYNKDAYSIHCKEYNQYQEWLNNRNNQRYVNVQQHGQQIDGKNLMHCMRLIHCGLEIAMHKTLTPFMSDWRRLLSIRRGELNLDEIIEEGESKIQLMNELFKDSNLPDKFDMNIGNELLLKIRNL